MKRISIVSECLFTDEDETLDVVLLKNAEDRHVSNKEDLREIEIKKGSGRNNSYIVVRYCDTIVCVWAGGFLA